LIDGPSSEEAWLMAFNIFLYQYDYFHYSAERIRTVFCCLASV
jgi:hypothetical protein